MLLMGNSNSRENMDSTNNSRGATSPSRTIYITSEDGKLPTNHAEDMPIHKPQYPITQTFTHPPVYKDHFSSLLIPHNLIQTRAAELAFNIHNHHSRYAYPHDEPLVILCILKGSSPFCQMVLTELSKLGHPYMPEFIRVKSYVGNESSGNVQIWGSGGGTGLPKSIKGRHVIIIEDIIDTGLTLSALLPRIQAEGPKSVNICTMLIKRLGENEEVTNVLDVDWHLIGFSIPNAFVVGFGLDYNEMYRDLLDIFVLNEKGVAHGGYGNDL